MGESDGDLVSIYITVQSLAIASARKCGGKLVNTVHIPVNTDLQPKGNAMARVLEVGVVINGPPPVRREEQGEDERHKRLR